MTAKELGKAGEYRAMEYLDKRGYEILEKNFKCRYGEVDLIAATGGTICFIEVKTRSSLRHGLPAEAVGPGKLRHIIRCSQAYLGRNHRQWQAVRIDVIEVLYMKGRYFVRHLKNVSF